MEAYHAGIIRTLLFQDGALPVKPYSIQTVDFVQACPLLPLHLSQDPSHARVGLPTFTPVTWHVHFCPSFALL